MKVKIGKVTGQAIEKNLDGDLKVRMLQVQITEPEDVQGIQQVLFSGNDTAPDDGDIVYILEIDDRFKIAIGSDDGIEPTVSKGEKKIYSHLDGIIKAYSYFKKNGNIELNGSGDYAVRFNKLKETIDELQNDITTLKTAFSTWVVVAQDGGAALKTAAGAWFATPLVKPIDPSKVDNVEVSS